MEQNHISSSFDKDLNKLNNNLLKLGNTALDQFEKCINNFGTQNLDEIKTVINSDKILDDLDDKTQFCIDSIVKDDSIDKPSESKVSPLLN